MVAEAEVDELEGHPGASYEGSLRLLGERVRCGCWIGTERVDWARNNAAAMKYCITNEFRVAY